MFHVVECLGFVVGKDDDMWRVDAFGAAKVFADKDVAIEEFVDDSIDVVYRCGVDTGAGHLMYTYIISNTYMYLI